MIQIHPPASIVEQPTGKGRGLNNFNSYVPNSDLGDGVRMPKGGSISVTLTPHHATFFAHELTKRCPSDSIEKLAGALVDAQVDLNPHQVRSAGRAAAGFAITGWRLRSWRKTNGTTG
jgi:hypothetical protein